MKKMEEKQELPNEAFQRGIEINYRSLKERNNYACI